jgi:hypothetical protein
MPAQAPGGRFPLVVAGMSNRGRLGPGRFSSKRFYGRFTISGVTRDSSSNPIPNCDVHLFDTARDTELDQTTSDGSGNYTFSLGTNSGFFYVVAYKPGAPDVAGTTVNTLVAA